MPRPAAAQPTRHRRLSWRRRALFALVPLLALALLAELAARLARSPLHFGSFRQLRLDMLARNYPAALDDQLGYVPRGGFASRDNHWGTLVSIDADGMRKNGAGRAPDGATIVAVGDSFTFGDQVDDNQTWPARLEAKLGRPVKNGGVFGYSLVQTALRGERLVERLRPQTLIVSLIADDLRRCTYSRRYTPVPWFDLTDDGGLSLRGVPIDHEHDRMTRGDGGIKDLLGLSALLDAILANTMPRWWIEQDKQTPVDHLWAHTAELGRRIVDRLHGFCRAREVELLVVLQGQRAGDDARAVLRHADERGIRTVDLVAAYEAMSARDATRAERWFDGHMTAEGNDWVAERIAAVLRR